MERIEVIKRRDAFERDPEAFVTAYGEADANLRAKIEAARALIGEVHVSDTVLEDCASLCIALGSDGLRGELTLLRAGRALAAYQGVEELERAHLRRVAPITLSHRLRRDPLDEAGSTTRVNRTLETVLA
jgi:magnesium chelatase subunit I